MLVTENSALNTKVLYNASMDLFSKSLELLTIWALNSILFNDSVTENVDYNSSPYVGILKADFGKE